MRRFLAIILWLGLCGPALAAYQPGAVVQLPNVAAFTAGNFINTQQVQISGYINPSDGGQGTLIYKPTGCGSVDGLYCFHDAAGNAFARTNVNGAIQQAGVVLGSDYDCSPTTGIHGSALGCSDASSIFANLQTVALANGVSTVSTAGMQVKFATSPTIQSGLTWDAGATSNTCANKCLDQPGTIWLADGQTVNLSGQSTLRNFIILPTWYGITYGTAGGPASLVEAYAVVASEASHAMTGVTCNAQSCTTRDGMIAGFDTGYDGQLGDNSVDNVLADADVCFYFHHSGSGTHWGTSSCQPYLIPQTVNGNSWFISAVAESPHTTGICEVTITDLGDGPIGNNQITTGMTAWVSGLGGAPDPGGANANGQWTITVIDRTHIDLQGSSCSGGTLIGPSTSATWISGAQWLTGVADLTNIIPGEVVSSSTSGIQSNTTVLYVWTAQNMVLLSKTTTAASGGSVGVTFTGGAATPQSNCAGACFLLTAQERVNAGASAGGVAAGGAGCATGYLVGGFSYTPPAVDCYTGDVTNSIKVSGFDIYSSFCYAHAICYHLANAYNFRFTSAGMDSARNLGGNGASWALVEGNVKNGAFNSGVANKAGAGLILNPTGSTDKGTINVSNLTLGTYEVNQGGLGVTGASHGNVGNVYVADAATQVSLNGYLTNTSVYCVSAVGCGVVDTSGSNVLLGSSWWGGHFTPGGWAPTVDATTLAAVASLTGNDTTGTFIVGTWSALVQINFANMWPTQPGCEMFDVTDPLILFAPTAITPSHMTFGASGGGPTAGDKIKWQCGSSSP